MKRSHLKSQNFIRRPQLVKTLVGHSNLKKSDTVYDIGAGSGIISFVLAQSCQKVIAIESDTRMIKTLTDNLADFPNVDIVNGDFLQLPTPTGHYKVFANIPFHLSSPILRKLTESDNPPNSTYLIVQKQFAKKLIIGEGTAFTGLLGAMVAPRFQTRIRYKLERTDFLPHPAVDTAMIELLLRDTPLLAAHTMDAYRAFVELCFSRQKYFATIMNGDKRPSQLTAEEWVSLFQSVNKK